MMKRIDILSDNAFEFTAGFKGGKKFVCYRRLDCLFEANKVARKFVEWFGVLVKEADIKNRIRVITAGDIKPVGSAKVWNAGACGNPGSGQDSDGPSFGN